MDKFLYLTDVHYGFKPLIRKDDYNSAIIKKLKFCFDLAQKEDRIILMGGDFFDTPKVSGMALLKLFEFLMQYPKEFFKDVYIVWGNASHDGFIENSPLSLLVKLGFFQFETCIESPYAEIHFVHNNSKGMNYDVKFKTKKVKILCTHDTIVKESVPFPHVLIDQFKTEADIVLLAHYHPKQGIVESGKQHSSDATTFISPGALARRKRIRHDMERIPCCVRIDIEKTIKKIEMVDVPCDMGVWTDKPPMIEDLSIFNDDMEYQIQNMKNEIDTADTIGTIDDMIISFGNKLNIESKIINACITKIRSK